MKNTLIPIAGAAMLFMALAQTIQAVPITGNIGFTGRVSYDTTSAGTATEVTSWTSPSVNGTTGAFVGIANATPVTFTSSPWFFNTPGSGPVVNPFWQVGTFTFNLLSSWIVFQGAGSVVVSGTGTITSTDTSYSATQFSWSFTSQDPAVTSNPSTFTFSASSNSVPDGGATVMLLGIALSGAALLRKKFVA